MDAPILSMSKAHTHSAVGPTMGLSPKLVWQQAGGKPGHRLFQMAPV